MRAILEHDILLRAAAFPNMLTASTLLLGTDILSEESSANYDVRGKPNFRVVI